LGPNKAWKSPSLRSYAFVTSFFVVPLGDAFIHPGTFIFEIYSSDP
jgi:hypothetical protein